MMVQMKISANELRVGMIIERNGKLWTVGKTQHVKPGKGGAFVQVEMKTVKGGVKANERFRSNDMLEQARLDEEEHQFLYQEGSAYTFMNTTNYEQIQIERDIIGDGAFYLKENMIVKILMHEGEIVSVAIPDTVVMTVVEADAVVKSQTAASSYKPAVLENGVRIMVPPHIEAGTRIIVNTADSTYVERAK